MEKHSSRVYTKVRRSLQAMLLAVLFSNGSYLQGQSLTSTEINDLESLSTSPSAKISKPGPLGIDLGFGPFVGGGRGSDGMDVRYASGFELNLSKVFSFKETLGAPIALGPQLAVSNTVVSTKTAVNETDKSLNRYDHRTGLLGIKFKWDESYGLWSTPLFITASSGITFSKLSSDKTTANSFQQIDINRIIGRVYQGEIGSAITLTDGLSAQLSWVNTLYRLDQTQSQGTFEGEYLGDDQSLGLLEGTYTLEGLGFPSRPILRIWSIKLGLSAAI